MIYFDDFGYLTTREKDGGDAAHREALARLMNHIHGSDLFGLKRTDEEFIKDFRAAPGFWRRHPDQTKWYSNPFTTTRDQMVPVICWLLMTNQNDLLSEIRGLLRFRNWFFPNTVNGWDKKEGSRDGQTKQWWRGEFPDYCTPELKLLLEPDRFVRPAQLSMLLSSMSKAGKLPSYDLGKGFAWGDPTHCDDTSHICVLLTYRFMNPTLVSRAIDIYKNEALWPPAPLDDHRIMARLKYWFRDEMGSNPGYAEAMRPIIEEYF